MVGIICPPPLVGIGVTPLACSSCIYRVHISKHFFEIGHTLDSELDVLLGINVPPLEIFWQIFSFIFSQNLGVSVIFRNFYQLVFLNNKRSTMLISGCSIMGAL